MERLDYGPRTDQVSFLVFQLSELQPEQIGMILFVAEDRGPGDTKYAMRAARIAGRETEVRRASTQAGRAVEKYASHLGPAGWAALEEAASDAGVAVATRDLIGVAWYGQSDYDRLVAPVKEGCPEAVQNSERGSE